MILTPGKGGIFQFLSKPAAQTTFRKGLWFMTSALALSLTCFRPCCGSPFLPQNFTSSLTATIHSPPLQPLPKEPFPQIQTNNLGYLHSPSWDPSLSPALFTTVLLDLPEAHSHGSLGATGYSFLSQSLVFSQLSNAWFFSHKSCKASKVAISTQNCHQAYTYLFFIALEKSNFLPFGFQSCAFFFLRSLSSSQHVFRGKRPKVFPSSLICLNSSFKNPLSCPPLA